MKIREKFEQWDGTDIEPGHCRNVQPESSLDVDDYLKCYEQEPNCQDG
jgi:hypothetical protein